MIRACALAAVASVALLTALPAQTPCRQALALGLDVSGSVDSREYRMQLQGLAAALLHRDVQAALLAMPGTPVKLALYEWSGPANQSLILPWTPITSAQELAQISTRLTGWQRRPAEQSTALGEAMRFGLALLSTQSQCWRRTLDISGDGTSNTGSHPQQIAAAPPQGVTINALVIGADALDHGDARQSESAELAVYFQAYVLRGPDSFVEIAQGFEDYEQAMVRKLLRELQGFALSQAQTIAPNPANQ